MRWTTVVVGLLLILAVTGGCKQQCFLTCGDEEKYIKGLDMPQIECSGEPIPPHINDLPDPSSVNFPDQEIRYLSLAEAIAISLEQGTVGSTFLNGQGSDSLVSFQGRSVFGSDAIRVLSVDPAIVGADIEASLSKFDARFVGSVNWNTTDRPIASALDQFQAAGNGNINAIRTQDATASFALLKPLPSGGVAGITFSNAYEFTNLPARVNPSYRPALQFQFEQPLLQGFGTEINELRTSHPGSVLTPFNNQSRVEGILITRIRFDQQRAEFERNVHIMLANVEQAYWNLYGAYWNLYSREAALRQAYEAWKINKAKFDAGRLSVADFAQTRGQYELFRGQRLTAMGQVLENERQLRKLMGVPTTDKKRIVPIDAPTLAPYQPDWHKALHDAITLRPELVLAREDLKFRQLDLINQRNLLLPDVRFTSTYDMNGIGSRLDGADGDNALRSLASDHFNNWSVGLRADIPLGMRDAHAAVVVARLNVARSLFVLQDQENKATEFLTLQYRHLSEFYDQIGIQRAQREAYGRQLEARFQEYLAGRGTLDILLEAQRFWADALASEYANIVNYNNTLVAFEFAKGTILQHDNVVIAENGLPECAKIRAVVHEEERTRALVLREHALPKTGMCGLPDVTSEGAVPLPALLQSAPKMDRDMPLVLPPATGETSSSRMMEMPGSTSSGSTSFRTDRPASTTTIVPVSYNGGATSYKAPKPSEMNYKVEKPYDTGYKVEKSATQPLALPPSMAPAEAGRPTTNRTSFDATHGTTTDKTAPAKSTDDWKHYPAFGAPPGKSDASPTGDQMLLPPPSATSR